MVYCFVIVATLKIILYWKFASHQHPDFDWAFPPTLMCFLLCSGGHTAAGSDFWSFFLLMNEHSSFLSHESCFSYKPLHSSVQFQNKRKLMLKYNI